MATRPSAEGSVVDAALDSMYRLPNTCSTTFNKPLCVWHAHGQSSVFMTNQAYRPTVFRTLTAYENYLWDQGRANTAEGERLTARKMRRSSRQQRALTEARQRGAFRNTLTSLAR